MPRLIRSALARADIVDGAVASGVDVVGDIAVVRVPTLKATEKRRFGEALLDEIRSVKAVYEQEGPVEGAYRLRRLKHVAGDQRTTTVHRENGCSFRVDVAKCYFSPRLSTERLRVAHEVKPGERVLNMFAGVGPFTIPIAKRGMQVVSCELNDLAARLHSENNRANKVEGLVRVINDDALHLPGLVDEKFDRVLMPHPSMADRFVPAALGLAKKKATIHYYRHVLGADPDEAKSTLRKEVAELFPRGARAAYRKVRVVGPRWVEMVADVKLAA